MIELTKERADKIIKIMESCENKEQFNNFWKVYKDFKPKFTHLGECYHWKIIGAATVLTNKWNE